MRIDDVRFLFEFDRWATRRILDAAARLPATDWGGGPRIDERTLGDILVHQLGASQRWRHGLADDGRTPRPEREPLPTVEDLLAAWESEWTDFDVWLDTLDDAWLRREDEGVAFWQMLIHVVNHGTQHRSEAAVLLTAAGQSPGDLDLIDFAEARAGEGD